MATNSGVTIVGNLTRDPELRFTPSGQATASFGVAVNRRWQNRQSQEWNEATSFFDVVCWAELAENAAQSLTRGTRVIVSGRLDQRSWENQDGEKRSKIEIVADEVAPSLRYATAQISRNERRSPDGSSGGGYNSNGGGQSGSSAQGGSYGGSQPSTSQANGGTQARPAGNEAPQGDYQYEEEPF
jgi:single-strand DNA-binding protein